MIDAAEWVGPVQDRRLGLHKAAKYYYSTGWHEPSTTTELLMSKKAFEGSCHSVAVRFSRRLSAA